MKLQCTYCDIDYKSWKEAEPCRERGHEVLEMLDEIDRKGSYLKQDKENKFNLELDAVDDVKIDSGTDLLIELIELLSRTVKGDENLTYQVLFNGFSAFTKNPTNLMVMEKSSEGKSYPALQIAQHFPKKHVWKLGSVSPQAFKYEYGMLVDSNYEPIDSIEEIETKIEEAKEKKDREARESLEKKKFELLKKAKTLVDLRGKWIIFKEPPDTKLLEALYSTLSNDEEYNEHKFVNKVGGGGNKQFTVVFRGSPAILICTAKDETKSKRWLETFSRFHIVSPVQSAKKYREGMGLISKSYGLPKELYEEQVISESEKRRMRTTISHIVKTLHNSNGEIFNSFQDELDRQFPQEAGYRWRQYQRFNSMIKMHSIIYSDQRPKLLINSRKVVTAIKADLKWTNKVMRDVELIPPNKLKWFNEVFQKCYEAKKENVNFGSEANPMEKDVVIVRDIVEYYSENNLGKTTTKQIREIYVETLFDHGIIEKDQDPRNKTRDAYWPADRNYTVANSSLIVMSSFDEACVKSCLDKYLKRRFSFEFDHKKFTQDEIVEHILSEWDIVTHIKNVISELKIIPKNNNGGMAINDENKNGCLNSSNKPKQSIEKSKSFFCKTCNAGPFRLTATSQSSGNIYSLHKKAGHSIEYLNE